MTSCWLGRRVLPRGEDEGLKRIVVEALVSCVDGVGGRDHQQAPSLLRFASPSRPAASSQQPADMAWGHLDIDKPHLAYILLGGFTSLFMVCSVFITDQLYITEATVATLCGLIFGPHAANLFDPAAWGNVDKITLEISRIILVVECFTVGVDLPMYYVQRHWKSVITLLGPVMTGGWLMSSLFIWWMAPSLNWLDSLVCAACVTATDPILASSIVGKNSFAKRIPKRLRDLVTAESGCNDGMTFPFIYLSIYIIRYRPDANQVAFHWFCYTLLYECVFGSIFGAILGYAARHIIKFAERKSLVDRHTMFIFYFIIPFFCAGCGSMLGMDDLLIGFFAGASFGNDGWFAQTTGESDAPAVIQLLLNLAYFFYFGSIIPWDAYNSSTLGLPAWRLIVIGIFFVLFRRIPFLLLLKPIIPDIKSWSEALFAGHFGPVGVASIFASILAKAELETRSTQPPREPPAPGSGNHDLAVLIWPITTFLVVTSIVVHGSSITLYTLATHVNAMVTSRPAITTGGGSVSAADQPSIGDVEHESAVSKDSSPAGVEVPLKAFKARPESSSGALE